MLLIYLIFREFFTVIAIFQHNFVLHEAFPEVHPPVMSNTVDMTRVEKYFSQLVRADKLSQLDSRSCRVENASH